jgi:Flp pilus assembly protein TadG
MPDLKPAAGSSESVLQARSFWKRFRLRILNGEEGGSLVEMAICFPILLAIVSGIATFGWYFNNYISLTEATSVGARQLSLNAGVFTDPCAQTISAIEAATPGLNASHLTFSFVLNGTSYPSTTSCTAGASNLVSGSTATVTATYACTALIFYSSSQYGTNLFPSCSMTSTISELVQ